MDVGKMIVELLYWIVEGACFLFSGSLLVTRFLGYVPRKGRGGKWVLFGTGILYAVVGWLLYVAFHSRLPEGEGQSTTLNGVLCLFLLVYWTFRLNVKKGKAFLLTFAMIELMMVLMGICGSFFAVVTEGMELGATGERVSDILFYLVWTAIIWGMSLISGRRRKGPMPSIQVFSIFLITLLVNLVLSFLNPGSYLSQNQPIFTLRLSYDGTNGDAILNGMVLLIGLGILLVTMLLSIRDSEVRYFRDKNLLNEYYLETQKEHYEQQSEANREMRRIRHDVKNHAYVMQELLRRKDYGELETYLSQLTKEMEQADVSVHVGNDIADAILSEKKQKAEKRSLSAKAPVIRAGVKAANMHWKATKASSGMVPFSMMVRPTPARPTLSRLPMKPPTSVPKAMA